MQCNDAGCEMIVGYLSISETTDVGFSHTMLAQISTHYTLQIYLHNFKP